jgi:hypothetical protein
LELENVVDVEEHAEQLAWMRERTDEECLPRPPGFVE